ARYVLRRPRLQAHRSRWPHLVLRNQRGRFRSEQGATTAEMRRREGRRREGATEGPSIRYVPLRRSFPLSLRLSSLFLLAQIADQAATAQGLALFDLVAFERRVNGGGEEVGFHLGSRVGIVHRAHVDDLAVLVQHEELRRVIGAEFLRDLLRFIE